jgi:hypothetical protein
MKTTLLHSIIRFFSPIYSCFYQKTNPFSLFLTFSFCFTLHISFGQCPVVNINNGASSTWTVPAGGTYKIKITARGAKGGGTNGGNGATMIGEFSVTSGQLLEATAGLSGTGTSGTQLGTNGGGASGVKIQGANLPLIMAGGGGGSGGGGNITAGDNTGNGGTGGTSGISNSGGGGGGGGFLTNGWSGSGAGGQGGTAGIGAGGGNGGMGGMSTDPMFPVVAYNGGCGGGGGFVGGNGGGAVGGAGSGGFSYNAGTNQINTADANNGSGSVRIEIIESPTKSLFVSADVNSSAGVSILDNNALDLTTELTLEAWIKPTTFTANLWQGSIITKDNWVGDVETGYVLRCGGTGVLDFTYGNGTNWISFVSNTNALTLNVWQHVVVTFKQNEGVKMYVNGILQTLATTGAVTSAISTNAQNLGIGTDLYDANKRNFKGNIDNVKIWNRVLSQTEINFVKDNRPTVTTNLVLSLEMNETSGTNVPNTTTNGVGNGTIQTFGSGTYSWQCEGILLNNVTASTLFVKHNATGQNNGTSWIDAFTDLQDALIIARISTNYNQIWVAAGTYYPTPSLDRAKFFQLENNLALYGGFVGSETMLSQRNWVLNPTILSGNIKKDNIVNNKDSYHVFFNNYSASNQLFDTAILSGFTIRGAYANEVISVPYGQGGGMLNIYASPTIEYCKFVSNGASSGGAMYNSYSSPKITNVSFEGNLGFYDAGGVRNDNQSSAIFTNCVFIGNAASGSGISGYGKGGAVFNSGSNVVFQNCTFSGNVGELLGGAIHNQSPSALITIKNCIIWGNSTYTYTANFVETEIYSQIGSATILNISQSILRFGTFGNIDPLFVSQPAIALGATGNLQLQACSPALHAGNNTGFTANDQDILGNPRIFDFANGGKIELGAYEYQGIGSPQNYTLTTPYINTTQTVAIKETLTATNAISNANVSYQAGKSIILGAGFKADNSAVFEAKIQNVCPN